MNHRTKLSGIIAFLFTFPLLTSSIYMYHHRSKNILSDTNTYINKNTVESRKELELILDQFGNSSLTLAKKIASTSAYSKKEIEPLVDQSRSVSGIKIIFSGDRKNELIVGDFETQVRPTFQLELEKEVITFARNTDHEIVAKMATSQFQESTNHLRFEFQLDKKLSNYLDLKSKISSPYHLVLWSQRGLFRIGSVPLKGELIESEQEFSDFFHRKNQPCSTDSNWCSFANSSKKYPFVIGMYAAKDHLLSHEKNVLLFHVILSVVQFLICFLLLGNSFNREESMLNLSKFNFWHLRKKNGFKKGSGNTDDQPELSGLVFERSPLNKGDGDKNKRVLTQLKEEVSSLRVELEASKLNLSMTLDSAPNAILTVDAEGFIIQANRELERMFGYTKKEFLNMNVDQLVPSGFRGNHKKYRETYLKAPTDRTMSAGRDLHALKKGGIEFPVEVGIAPIRGRAVHKVMCSIVDVTERKAIAKTLTSINESLLEKSAEIEQFVYTVSHDLKAPLVTAMGFLTYLERDLASGSYEKAQDSLRRVFKAAKKMDMLVEDLLQFSRVGYVDLEMHDVNINIVIESVLSQFKSAIEEAGVGIDVQKDLGFMKGDEFRITQVFDNLIGNAIKYGRTSGGLIKIGRTAGSSGNFNLFVKDNGEGIHSDYLEKIFELFQRLESDKSGTGVGLSIVKKIVELHHGRVWVESQVGIGTTFWISLPERI